MTKVKDKHTNRHDSYIKRCLSDRIAMRELIEISFSKDMLEGMNFKTLRTEKTDFIDDELGHSHCDILLSIEYNKKKSYIYTLVEHQSTVDHSMVTRMLKYMLHIYDTHAAENPKSKKIPLVCPLIIYSGKTRYTADKSLWEKSEHPDRAKQFFPVTPIKVIDLQKTKEEEIDLDKRYHIGFIFYIMKNIFSKNIYGCIKKVEATIKLLCQKNKGLKFVGNALCYTMTTANDIKEKEELVRLFVNNIPQEYRGEFMTIADQFREQGVKQGAEKERLFIINNMVKNNLEISEIASITGLHVSEVKRVLSEKKD